MMYAGVKDVRILNGGLRAWEDEGYPVTKVDSFPEPGRRAGRLPMFMSPSSSIGVAARK